MKINKSVFIATLFVAIFQIALASRAVIEAVLRWDDFLLLTMFLASFLLFTICLYVIFSYILDRIKWLDKRSFLNSFIFVFIALFIFAVFAVGLFLVFNLSFFLGFFEKFVFVSSIFGFIIGKPLAFILGWYHSDSKVIILIVGVFTFAATFAVLYSRLSLLAKRGSGLYKKVFVYFLLVILFAFSLLALSDAWVSRLIHEGKCTYGLTIFDCFNYEDLGSDYFSVKEDVYFMHGHIKLNGETLDEFEVFDNNNEGFAIGREHAYYNGDLIPVSNINRWHILNNTQYQDGLNRYSADGQNVFFQIQVLRDAYPEDTVVFGENYSCNDRFVYYQGKIIEGADVDGFVETGCMGIARDRLFFYSGGYDRGDVNDYYGDSECYNLVKGSCKEARVE